MTGTRSIYIPSAADLLTVKVKSPVKAPSKPKPKPKEKLKPRRLATITGIASTGTMLEAGCVRRVDLSLADNFTPVVLDLDSLQVTTPTRILLNHNFGQLAGFATKIKVVNGNLMFWGHLVANPHGNRAVKKSRRKPYQCSLLAVRERKSLTYIKPKGDLTPVNGRTFEDEITVCIGWKLLEVSLLYDPGDTGTLADIRELK